MHRAQVYLYPFIIVLILAFAVWGLGDTVGALAFAFFLTYLLFPLVKRLESPKAPRALVALTLLVGVSALTVLVLVLVIPRLYRETVEFFQELPAKLTMIWEQLENLQHLAAERGFDVRIPVNREQVIALLTESSSKVPVSALSSVTDVIRRSFSNSFRFILALLDLFLIPVFFFYILTSYDRIKAEAVGYVPPRHRPAIGRFFKRADTVLSGYIRGQLLVCLALSVLYGLGLSIVGLRFGILIGLLAGFGNLIPYVGFVLGIATALLVAVTNYTGPGLIVGLMVVFMVVQAFESFLLTPRIVGDKVGLNPLLTILVLIIGGNLGGLLGMLVAIPVTGVLKILYEEFKTHYRQSEYYLGR